MTLTQERNSGVQGPDGQSKGPCHVTAKVPASRPQRHPDRPRHDPDRQTPQGTGSQARLPCVEGALGKGPEAQVDTTWGGCEGLSGDWPPLEGAGVG